MTRWRAGALSAGLAAVAALVGCEWEQSGDDESWNDTYSWVNFSGEYHSAAAGAPLVVEVGGGAASPPEVIGVGDGVRTEFSATLSKFPVTAGSVSVSTAIWDPGDPSMDITLTDAGGTGTLSGTGGGGSVNYNTGFIIVRLNSWVPAGVSVVVSYSYVNSGAAGTGVAIYTFSVYQMGNYAEFTDSMGKTYSGRLYSVSTGTGSGGGGSSSVGRVVARFEVAGTSAGGQSVRMVGSFAGEYTETTDTTTGGGGTATRYVQLVNRTMQGTWIEPSGVTGNINGVSDSPYVTVGTGTTRIYMVEGQLPPPK